jgi:hypothetical protein
MLQDLIMTITRLEKWILPLIMLVVAVKFALFMIFKTRQCRFYHFFYFEDSQIVSGRSLKKVTARIIQNCLSFYLLFLVVFDIILLLTCCRTESAIYIDRQ